MAEPNLHLVFGIDMGMSYKYAFCMSLPTLVFIRSSPADPSVFAE